MICVAVDWITTSMAFFVFNIFRFYYIRLGDDFDDLMSYLLSGKLILEQFAVPTGLLLVYWLSGYYNRPFEKSRLQEFLTTLYTQIFNALLIYLLALTNEHLNLRKEHIVIIASLFIFLFVFTLAGRLMVTNHVISNFKKSKWTHKTVIGGISHEAIKLAERLNNLTNNGFEIVGFVPL